MRSSSTPGGTTRVSQFWCGSFGMSADSFSIIRWISSGAGCDKVNSAVDYVKIDVKLLFRAVGKNNTSYVAAMP